MCNHIYIDIPTFSDDDECTAESALCEHDCINTPASYVCTCDDGYLIDENGWACNGTA